MRLARHTANALLLLCAPLCVAILFFLFPRPQALLTVAFLDVGQGDAIFIESPTGSQMLIDGGSGRSVLRELGNHMAFSDRSLDVVLATHADADHIGGLSHVLTRYNVGVLLFSGVESDTPAYEAFARATAAARKRYVPQRGMVIDLGGGAYARVLFPDRALAVSTETNASSAVVEVVYGDIEFLLTGDAPASIESYVTVLEGSVLRSEVLKAGHHGSRTSSSEMFVRAVAPTYAIISAGVDNRYGHPHAEVVERLRNQGAEVFSTAKEGTVVFESDGKELWLKRK